MAKTTTLIDEAPPVDFDAALREGPDLAREWRRWDTAAGRKQAADAMLADALAKAGRTLPNIDDFAFQLDDLPPGFERLPAALRRLERIVAEPTTTSGYLTRMPKAWLDDDERAELIRLKMSPWDLWAVAVARVGERRPEVFGLIDKPMAEHQAYLKDLRARLDAVGEILRTRYAPADVVDLNADTSDLLMREGYTLQVYRIPYEATGDKVYRPPPGSGRVLLDWLLDHPEVTP